MPRDSWLLDRETMQPGSLFADKLKASFTAQLRAINDAASVQDLFAHLENAGVLLRIDPAIRPAMYRCATVTRLELEQLRRITDVVRMGHLLAIEADRMVLDGGTVGVGGDELYIDCTADGAEKRPATPIFDAGGITLQSVRGCQQIFSAALIAHVEAAYPDDAVKNQLCVPLPHPDTDLDWLRLAQADYSNQLRWFDDPNLMSWLAAARLDLFGHLIGHLLPSASAKPRVRTRILSIAKSAFSATATKLDQLMAAASRPRGALTRVTRADIHRVKEACGGKKRTRRAATPARGARRWPGCRLPGLGSRVLRQRDLGVPHAVRARRQPDRRRGPHRRGVPRRAAAAAADRERRRGARVPASDGQDGAGRALARDPGSGDHLDRGHRTTGRTAEDAISTAPPASPGVLDTLPDNYRRILDLRFLQGRSIKESAEETGGQRRQRQGAATPGAEVGGAGQRGGHP